MDEAVQLEHLLEEMKRKYASVLALIERQGARVDDISMRQLKLFIQGRVRSEQIRNEVLDRIIIYPELVTEITVDPAAHPV